MRQRPGIAIIAAANILIVFGCSHSRNFATNDARDYGEHPRTRYRYCVVNCTKQFAEQFALAYPGTFSQDGIPVEISTYQGSQPGKTWSYLNGNHFFLTDVIYVWCVIGTGFSILPLGINGSEKTISYDIRIVDANVPISQLKVFEREDGIAGGFIPIVQLSCFHGDPAPDSFQGGRRFETHEYTLINGSVAKSNFSAALVYGVVSRLKEMEDSGIINEKVARNGAIVRAKIAKQQQQIDEDIRRRQEAARRQKEQEARQKEEDLRRQRIALDVKNRRREIEEAAKLDSAPSAYTLDTLKWDDDKDFSCSFKIKLHGHCTIEAFFAIRNAFDANVRNSYLMMHPSVDERTLVVDVRPNIESGLIVGTAKVLTIAPESLSYNPNTRRGKLAIKFNPGQYEEARSWARKNIENLVMDKNIVLTTGQLPPPGRYYSLGESVEGNVMTIEFKTE